MVASRHLDYISQFTTNIQHVSGNDNPVADALSRQGHQLLWGYDDIDQIIKSQQLQYNITQDNTCYNSIN